MLHPNLNVTFANTSHYKTAHLHALLILKPLTLHVTDNVQPCVHLERDEESLYRCKLNQMNATL